MTQNYQIDQHWNFTKKSFKKTTFMGPLFYVLFFMGTFPYVLYGQEHPLSPENNPVDHELFESGTSLMSWFVVNDSIETHIGDVETEIKREDNSIISLQPWIWCNHLLNGLTVQ